MKNALLPVCLIGVVSRLNDSDRPIDLLCYSRFGSGQGYQTEIEFYHGDKVELDRLTEDPGERRELSQVEPEKAEELRTRLHEWQQALGARMPAAISPKDSRRTVDLLGRE